MSEKVSGVGYGKGLVQVLGQGWTDGAVWVWNQKTWRRVCLRTQVRAVVGIGVRVESSGLRRVWIGLALGSNAGTGQGSNGGGATVAGARSRPGLGGRQTR